MFKWNKNSFLESCYFHDLSTVFPNLSACWQHWYLAENFIYQQGMAFNKGQRIKIQWWNNAFHHHHIRCAFLRSNKFWFLNFFFVVVFVGATDSHYILIDWDENTTFCILRYKKVWVWFFLFFGRHPKVSAVISSRFWHVKKNPKTLKKYLIAIHMSHPIKQRYAT